MSILFAKFIRSLGYVILTFPARFIKIFLGMPNVRIVYNNGHVEDYFFVNWSYKKNGGNSEITWDAFASAKEPKIINVGEIHSIVELY